MLYQQKIIEANSPLIVIATQGDNTFGLESGSIMGEITEAIINQVLYSESKFDFEWHPFGDNVFPDFRICDCYLEIKAHKTGSFSNIKLGSWNVFQKLMTESEDSANMVLFSDYLIFGYSENSEGLFFDGAHIFKIWELADITNDDLIALNDNSIAGRDDALSAPSNTLYDGVEDFLQKAANRITLEQNNTKYAKEWLETALNHSYGYF